MTDKFIDLADKIAAETMSGRSGTWGVLHWLDDHPEACPGQTITQSSHRYVFDDATVLAVEFGRHVEDSDDEDGYLLPHPEFPDRHTITAMLKEGDQLPTVGSKDRITVIIEKVPPEPTLLPNTPGATVKMRNAHRWVRAATGAWISTDGSILDQTGAQELANDHGFEVIHDGVKSPEADDE